jgi:predicted Zn-dependent protease
MRILPVQRRTISAFSAATAVACFLFSVIALAQTSPLASQGSPVTASQPDDTDTVHTLSDDVVSGTLPTASDIQTQGKRTPDPADTAASNSSVLGTSVVKAPAPSAVIPSAPEPSKYDVTLIGHRNIGSGLNFYSLEREIAVGQDLARQVEQTSKLVTDPEITAYVNRIGQNLVRNSDSRVPFTIKVIDSGEINAFALPGGFFYVDSGLILAAESEAELAAIMAHEIAHVAARHATKNMTKQQIWTMASIPLMFVGGPAGYAIAEIANIAVPMSFLKFSRDSEREADMLGLQYDYAAGYDPQAFIQFFERLKAQEKQKHSKIAKMFSTHPMTADRISAAQSEIQSYLPAREDYVVDTSDFEAMKARLLSLQGHNRLDTDKSGNRPVLRKHTDEDAPATQTSTSGSSANSN